MNFTKASLSILTLASAFLMSSAHATAVTITPASNVVIGNDDVLAYTFDFTGQGYVRDTTTYSAGVLNIRLTDKAGSEGGFITVGDQKRLFSNLKDKTRDTADGNIYTFTLDAANLADLSADGKIGFSITGESGDFYFASATLSATPKAAAVPEPMSLGLLAIGMLGLGATRRRASK